MLGYMVRDTWVYRVADRVIAEHGMDAVKELNHAIALAVGNKQRDQALLMIQVKLAVIALQRAAIGPLH
jgi:hypothetical protein